MVKVAQQKTYGFLDLLPSKQMLPWVVPVGLLIIWQLLAQIGVISTRTLPAPTQVFEAAVRLTLNGELFRNLTISLGRAATGFLIGGSIGLALAKLRDDRVLLKDPPTSL